MATKINNWVTVELVANQAGQIVETVFPYKSSDMAITQSDLQAFVNGWWGIVVPLMQGIVSSEVTFTNAIAKTHFLEFPNVEADYTPGTGVAGTVTGDCSPGNVSLAVKSLTGVIGRSRRGRQFLYGIAESQTDSNQVISGYSTGLLTLFARNLTGFSYLSHVYLPAVASRKYGIINAVLAYAADAYIDSQRRRLTGRGR